jgi:macrolide transport system ATP-binding/permease protein
VFETLFADIRYALRWLRRSPAFTLIAVASLAIGIGFNTALFTIVDAVLFRPLPVERPDRLVDVYTTSRDGDTYATSSYLDYLDMKAKNEVFTDLLGYSVSLDAIKFSEGSRPALGEVVTGNYFQLLGVKPLLGRTLLPSDDVKGAPKVAFLSYRLWAREYGASPQAIGQSIRIHNHPYTIVGVAPREYTGMVPIISSELWTTMAQVDDVEPGGIIDTVPSPEGTGKLDRRGYRWMFIKGRLKPNQTVESAGANLQVVMQQLATAYVATNKDRRNAVMRTTDVHIHPEADKVLLPIAAGLMVVVGLVLLIACANVASMLLARASGRQREIGIRLAIGANRRRLVQQLLTESAVMATLGAAAGVGLAWGLTRAAASVTLPIPIPLTFGFQIDGRVLLFTMLVTVVAAMVAGLAPALKATRPNLVNELKGDVSMARAGSRRWTLRDGLVATQIAVTLVLLVTSGLLTRSLMAAQRVALGFKPEGLAVVSAEMGLIGYDAPRSKQYYDQVLARVSAMPDIVGAALTERPPFAVNYSRANIYLPDRHTPADKGITIDVTRVSPDYFAVLGIPILQGRNFNSADTATSPGVVIINETMARRYWPNQNALGRRMARNSLTGTSYEVVGIVADHKVSTVGEKPTPYLHFAYSQQPDSGEVVVARTRGDAGALVEAIRREMVALEPNVVILDHQTMDAQVGVTLLPARMGALSVSAVGVIAMLLAAIGLYGVIAYSVARRTREIGIRMALGARPGSVLRLIMQQGMTVAAAGAIGGALLAFAAAKAVSGALYGVSAVDPVAWGAAVGTLFIVSVLANLIPARRAAHVDPSVALRSE